MANSMLVIQTLDKFYWEGQSRRAVLKNLDLRLDVGQFAALIGSSGSGKSTLLNLISGIDQPDAGTIHVAGEHISALDEPARTRWRRRQLGFVFQFFNLIPTLTVEENLLLPLTLNKIDTASEKARAHELLAEVGLDGREQSFPERLSGGEQQRLAIARAIVHQPPLLLADEPTGNLDATTGEHIMDLLQRLTRQQNTTVLLVTHSDAVAARADVILRMATGHVENASLAPN